MSSADTLVPPKPAPPRNAPKSAATATVRIIDTTSYIYVPDQSIMFTPNILPEDNSVNCPSFSFLITSPGGEHVLFDLGVRKDPENFPPGLLKRLGGVGFKFGAKYSVSELLDQHVDTTQVPSSAISSVIWSHHHFDHVGDITTFPTTTPLVVGPGFLAENMPAYPEAEGSGLFTSDLTSRPVHEIDFSHPTKGGLRVGQCPAYDYFGDGSFYLLGAPGHTRSHVCGLARVAADPEAFVLMAGDAAHNMGELRPNGYHPLPSTIHPSPSARFGAGGCPGELVQQVLPKRAADAPVYEPAPSFNVDNAQAIETLSKLVEIDAWDRVLVVLAHDAALLDKVPLFPEKVVGGELGDLDERTRWAFLEPLGVLLGKDAA